MLPGISSKLFELPLRTWSGQEKTQVRLPRASKFWSWASKSTSLVVQWASKISPRFLWVCLQMSTWYMIISREELLQDWTQCCQLSKIIWEAPDFWPYLPVSRLESDISRIIAKGTISCRLDFPTTKFEIFASQILKVMWESFDWHFDSEHFAIPFMVR